MNLKGELDERYTIIGKVDRLGYNELQETIDKADEAANKALEAAEVARSSAEKVQELIDPPNMYPDCFELWKDASEIYNGISIGNPIQSSNNDNCKTYKIDITPGRTYAFTPCAIAGYIQLAVCDANDIVLDFANYPVDVYTVQMNYNDLVPSRIYFAVHNSIDEGDIVFKDGRLGKLERDVSEAKTKAETAQLGAIQAYNRANDAFTAVNKVYTMASGAANAIKGNASGAVIKLSDVSPLEHTLKVKMEAAEGVKLPKLKVTGKNLFDPSFLIAEGAVEQDGGWYFAGCTTKHPVVYRGHGQPGQIAISYKVQMPSGGQRFRVYYIGDTNPYSIGAVTSPDSLTEVKVVTSSTRTLDRIELDYGSSGIETYFKDIQFEYGSITPYEPFVGAEYTPNSDGTVNGVKSIYPNMVLKTDTNGVTIDAEYNRDLNKAYDALTDAIKALGGTIESLVQIRE
jgi:hypothetical protein